MSARRVSPARWNPRGGAACAAIVAAAALAAGCTVDPGVSAERSDAIEADATATSEPAPDGPRAAEPDEAGPRSEPADTEPPDTEPPGTDPVDTAPGDGDPDDAAPDTELPPPLPRLELGGRTLTDVADLGDGKAARPYDDLVAATLLDLEAWFAEVHPQIHGAPWEPLAGGVFPAYPGRDDVPGCGEPTTSYPDVNEYVAFYCSQNDTIVYDDGESSLLGALAAEFGPSVLGVVIAHEFGHVIQARTGDLARGLPTVVTEQQADCVAGAWVGRAARGGSEFVGLTDADVSGALITMVAVRDPVGIGQFEVGGHGTAFDRVGAFQLGFDEGIARCAELIDDPLPLMPNEFRSLIDARNDGDLPFGYDEGEIVPLIVGTLNEYWTFQLRELDVDTFDPLRLVPFQSMDEISCSGDHRSVAPGLHVCPADDVVYLDDLFARALYDDPIVGRADFAVGYLVALAWSDIVQDLLSSDLAGLDRSLANDCLAGAYTNDLDPLRPQRPDEEIRLGTISPGDLDEAVVAAIELGDDPGTAGLLGTPFDKIAAFRIGVLGGFQPCFERIVG